jgi:hypothetical protein
MQHIFMCVHRHESICIVILAGSIQRHSTIDYGAAVVEDRIVHVQYVHYLALKCAIL